MNIQITFTVLYVNILLCFEIQTVNSKVLDTIKSSMTSLVSKFESDFIVTEEKTIKEIRQHWHDPESKDLDLNISELVNKYGYQFEEHEIETKDGYIITLHRIPSKGSAVMLVHGIVLNSDAWILNGPENGLPFLLADKGYDVWMTNARGSTHSRKHKFLNTDSQNYWDFSFDEIGRYDHPASIDYILNLKGDRQLNYVGYSQGTTTFFIMCSELPEYNKKINLMISLSTISYLSNMYSPTMRFMLKTNAFSLLTNKYNLLPYNKHYHTLCNSFSISKFICANVLYAVFGYDLGQLNITNLPLIFRHIPAGASIKQMSHYRQFIFSTGHFRRYDYGYEINLIKYGSAEPPGYNVKRITAPIAIFHSHYDWFSNITDVMKIRNKLRNVVYFRAVNGTLNHIDYIFGKDAKNLIYLPILDLFNKFS